MPKPLIIDDPSTEAGPVWKLIQNALSYAVALAVVGFAYGALDRTTYAPRSPLFVGAIRFAVFVLPLLLAFMVLADAVRYRVRPGETLAGRWSYARNFPDFWWALLPTWPGLWLAAVAWYQKVAGEPLLRVGEMVSWPSALGAFLLTLALGFYYVGLLVSRVETRFDDDGVRAGLTRFMEWENVSQALLTHRHVRLFHRAWPSLPMRNIPRDDPAVETELMRHLKRWNIPVVQYAPTREPALIGLYVAATAALAVGMEALRDRRLLFDSWLVIVMTVAGAAACMLLERLRGMHRMTRVRPMTISAAAADAEAADPDAAIHGGPKDEPRW